MDSIKELNTLIEQTLELRQLDGGKMLIELYNHANMVYSTTMHVIYTYSENQQQVVQPPEEVIMLKENINRLASEIMRYETRINGQIIYLDGTHKTR